MKEENKEPEVVAFENTQWKVTDFGLSGTGEHAYYHIAAYRLADEYDSTRGKLYSWPAHMAEKKWVDVDQFNEAFAFALDFHASKYKPPLSARLLQRAIDAAHRIREQDTVAVPDASGFSKAEFDRLMVPIIPMNMVDNLDGEFPEYLGGDEEDDKS